ncbi:MULTISPECIES: MBL fold metallo-hydrolase [Yersinia]|uniref:MBL fold metallo-hydrolase n=1 Tax=Yersinia TaxID=629 RepID=UPI00164390FD|nr:MULTISPECIES: MBL fold metallo-hydrolase [Yersinia]MDA5544126.1 MBL fold metallo-hydrolase [Yersinia rochesterensis]MDN0107038.1 MBL fold metallo-hydrolase [Yersinia rochesterensis]MDR5019907.1 MBL fold metallo-hydrolase [Yersinia rochesterensis]UZM76286.1 MBL fold metallo-hydrolase [Yersinia sp. SCPM-O-B-9106 (C-191)]
MFLTYISTQSAATVSQVSSNKRRNRLLNAGLVFSFSLYSTLAAAGFEVVALGVDGGVSDGNLTSYLIRDDSQPVYLALDAGSVLPGIAKALDKGHFSDVTAEQAAPLTRQGYVFRQSINSYFISHAHLDHVSGLIIGSPEDSKKTIYASADTIDVLRNYYFNWRVWPNFTDSGSGTRLGTYRMQLVRPNQPLSLGLTRLTGEMYPLSHDKSPSSMLLISSNIIASNKAAFAYFGDTGPDEIEKSKNLDTVWRKLAEKVQKQQLKGMIIEVSYPNEVDDGKLYGHMTPKWLLKELKNLEKYSGEGQPLKGLPVVISHIKPSFKQGQDVRKVIAAELTQGNDMGVDFIIMDQGDSRKF